MFAQMPGLKKVLITFCMLLVVAILIISCAQPPAEEPEGQTIEPAATEAPTSNVVKVDYTDIFPTYPKELPSHCDPAKVQAAYEWAKEYWTLPVAENEGYTPMIRPAEERYKIGVIQGLGGWPAQIQGDLSVQHAADLMCVDLVWCDSKFDLEPAVNCAETIAQQDVDGVINENWVDAAMAPMAEILDGIPATVWDVPMPGAPFFGEDQCNDGKLKGEWLVNYVNQNYQGDIADIWVVPNVNYDVGELAMGRITCAIDVIKEALPEIPADHYVELPGGSATDQAYEAMTSWLTANPDAKLILGTAVNDNAAVGAAAACDSAGFTGRCVILGTNGEAQAWAELDKPDNESSFKGTADHTQIDDGRYMLPIVIDQIEGVKVPDYVYQHVYILNRDNMNEHLSTRPEE
jgi:ABC-type sugar transport system substrate-binding protein